MVVVVITILYASRGATAAAAEKGNTYCIGIPCTHTGAANGKNPSAREQGLLHTFFVRIPCDILRARQLTHARFYQTSITAIFV